MGGLGEYSLYLQNFVTHSTHLHCLQSTEAQSDQAVL